MFLTFRKCELYSMQNNPGDYVDVSERFLFLNTAFLSDSLESGLDLRNWGRMFWVFREQLPFLMCSGCGSLKFSWYGRKDRLLRVGLSLISSTTSFRV